MAALAPLAGSHETFDEEAVADQQRIRTCSSQAASGKAGLQGKDQHEPPLRAVTQSCYDVFAKIRQNLRRDFERADPCGLVVDHSGHHQLIRLEGLDQGAQLLSHRSSRACGGT